MNRPGSAETGAARPDTSVTKVTSSHSPRGTRSSTSRGR